MKISIQEIIVNDRIRKDAGNIEPLANSIQEIGLIHPVIINEKNELLSGYRRLQACKQLGWETIDAKIVAFSGDKVKELDWEFHENVGRENLDDEETKAYKDERRRLTTPPPEKSFWSKLWNWLRNLFRKDK